MRAHGQVTRLVAQRLLHQLNREPELGVGILAPGRVLGTHLLVTEIGQAHVVQLQVPATGRVEIGDLGPVGGGGVGHEGVEVGIGRAVDVSAAHLRVEHARRRDRQLGGAGDDGLQEREPLHEDRLRPGHPARDGQVGPGEVHVAGLAVKRHRDALALARPTAQLEQEVHVPGLATHLAVGDALQSWPPPGVCTTSDAASLARSQRRR